MNNWDQKSVGKHVLNKKNVLILYCISYIQNMFAQRLLVPILQFYNYEVYNGIERIKKVFKKCFKRTLKSKRRSKGGLKSVKGLKGD